MEMSKLEKAIKGLEQFKADFKPFCGNGSDWARVDAAISLLKEHGKEPERVMRIIRETIHQAMFESEKGKDFEDFVCELIEHRIYHTNR